MHEINYIFVLIVVSGKFMSFCFSMHKDDLKKFNEMFLEQRGLLPSIQPVKPIFINVLRNGAISYLL